MIWIDITGRGAKIIGDCIKRPFGPGKKNDNPKMKTRQITIDFDVFE